MAVVSYSRPAAQQRQANEHTFLKMEKVTTLGVESLRSMAWLPQMFTMFPGSRFKGALNDTLTFPTRRFTTAREYEWRTRLNPVQIDRIGTTDATVKLDTHIIQATAITNEQATLDLRSFGEEILKPQLESLETKLNSKVMKGLREAPVKHANINATSSDDPIRVAMAGYLALERAGVPKTGRRWIVGAAAEEWLLGSEKLLDPARGGNALARENVLGRLRNFDVISGSTLIGENEMYFAHESGLLVATVAPEAPFSVPNSFRASVGPFSLMGTMDYRSDYQSTVSTISSFIGVNSVNDELELDSEGIPKLDDNGDPILTGKNVRIAKGTFSA